MPLSSLDIALALVVLLFAVRAALRGFIQEAGGLAAWALGLLFAVSFYEKGAVFLRARLPDGLKGIPEALAFIALFAVVFLLIKITGGMLEEIISRLNMGALNALFGVLFGLLEGIAVSALAIFLIEHQPLFDKQALLEGSLFARFLGGTVETAAGMITLARGDICLKI